MENPSVPLLGPATPDSSTPDPYPSLNTPYFEAEYEIVEACKKFLKDCEDSAKTRVVNPWTSKTIKKYGTTYFKIYTDVKKYLNSVDEEEFHSPIRGVELLIQKVPPANLNVVDYHLTKKIKNDKICENWHLKVEKNLKDLEIHESAQEIEEQKSKITNWKYDSPIMNVNNEELNRRKERWMERNIQLYSYLDVYKPEVFEHKYLLKHLTCFDYNFTNFTNYLHYNCDLFLTKRYESSSHINPEQRYAPAMIMLWIYHPIILNGRKFLNKHKKRLETYIKCKPENTIKLAKQHISSLLLTCFILNAKIEQLEEIKKDYENYFEKIMTESLRKFEREGILGRIGYRTLFTNFLANRIRPYRYTDFTFGDLETFDAIIDGLDDKPKPPEPNPEPIPVASSVSVSSKPKQSQPTENRKVSVPSGSSSIPRQPTVLENPDSTSEEEETIPIVPLAPPRFLRHPKL